MGLFKSSGEETKGQVLMDFHFLCCSGSENQIGSSQHLPEDLSTTKCVGVMMRPPPQSSLQNTGSLGQEGRGKSQVKGTGSERLVDSAPASGRRLSCTEEATVPGKPDGANGPARTIPMATGSSQDSNPGRSSQVRPRGLGRAEQGKVLSPHVPGSEVASGKRPKRVRVAASGRTQQLVPVTVSMEFPAHDKAQAHSLTMKSVDGDGVPVDPASISKTPGGDQALQPLRPGQRQDLFFYVGGTNGATLVSAYCLSQGWQRLQDPQRQDYQLKWCEAKSHQAYSSFREGAPQLVLWTLLPSPAGALGPRPGPGFGRNGIGGRAGEPTFQFGAELGPSLLSVFCFVLLPRQAAYVPDPQQQTPDDQDWTPEQP
uniref:Uncharacterized protein n=1 Tax=Ornithorhynchus anatinus TaxID=9258 RepID=A0A6I8N004_ORNAN